VRVLVYCQPLTGLGHHVRALAIAGALAEAHEVVFTAGARPFPGERAAPGVRFLALPALWRREGSLAAADGRPAAEALAERAALLADAVRALRPDAVLVEHFPFGKWELADEARALITAARPGATVLCSLRDIALRGRYASEAGDEDETGRGRRTCAALREHFDAVLVHGDPAVTRLADQLPWAGAIPVPVHYTGYVTRPHPAAPPADAAGVIVVSAGGGVEAAEVVAPCLEAWPRLRAPGRRLVAFAGPYLPEAEFAGLAARCAAAGAELHRFTDDLAGWIGAADLSISRAGYNTCADVLASGARALLLPSPRMPDQALRARRLAELGLAETLADPTPDALAAAAARALARPRPRVVVDLDGAARTRALVEEIAGA